MLHVCVQKFDVMGTVEIFWELNMLLLLLPSLVLYHTLTLGSGAGICFGIYFLAPSS